MKTIGEDQTSIADSLLVEGLETAPTNNPNIYVATNIITLLDETDKLAVVQALEDNKGEKGGAAPTL